MERFLGRLVLILSCSSDGQKPKNLINYSLFQQNLTYWKQLPKMPSSMEIKHLEKNVSLQELFGFPPKHIAFYSQGFKHHSWEKQ